MKSLKILSVILGTFLFFGGCSLESGGGIANDGIVIYYRTEVLNGKNLEIVTDGVRQLDAMAVPSGDAILWVSDNPDAVSVDATGYLRANKNAGRKAKITASLRGDPSIEAWVTFTTKGLR